MAMNLARFTKMATSSIPTWFGVLVRQRSPTALKTRNLRFYEQLDRSTTERIYMWLPTVIDMYGYTGAGLKPVITQLYPLFLLEILSVILNIALDSPRYCSILLCMFPLKPWKWDSNHIILH